MNKKYDIVIESIFTILFTFFSILGLIDFSNTPNDTTFLWFMIPTMVTTICGGILYVTVNDYLEERKQRRLL